MPYKHIAAHLNKTELACRLHYHQLSHGSTRRKRTSSCSSGSSDPSTCQATASSPIFRGSTRSLSPSVAGGNYLAKPANTDMQLSRIMSVERSPRLLPAILPKPESLSYSRHASETLSRYSAVTPEQHYETLAPVTGHVHGSPFYRQSQAPPLRLDISRPSPPAASVHTPAHVDLTRLRAIYEGRKNAFWAVVADEYGMNASPIALEQAWKSGACCHYGDSNPITPVASPDKDRRLGFRTSSQDKTRISSILDDNTELRMR